MNPDELVEMVSALGSGQPEVISEYLRRYEADLRRVIRVQLRLLALTGNYDTMDVLQSIFKSFLFHPNLGQLSFETPQQLHAYLVTMALNKIRAYARKLRRQGNLPPAWEEADKEPSPLERLLTEELVNYLLSSLPDDERACVEEKVFEDRTFVEIGEKRGKNEAWVRRRVNRALNKLGEIVARME